MMEYTRVYLFDINLNFNKILRLLRFSFYKFVTGSDLD